MNKKTLVFLVAETGAGKDTVANKLPYPKIISYKASTMRDTDIQGVTHHFISDDDMDDLENDGNIIAWTNTGGIRYCTTVDQLKDDITIYIINPDGVRWFRKNYKGPELKYVVIGLYVPLEVRRSRCRTRSDFETMFESRVAAEQLDYDNFRLDGEFDYMINNRDSTKTAAVIYDIIQKDISFNNFNNHCSINHITPYCSI